MMMDRSGKIDQFFLRMEQEESDSIYSSKSNSRHEDGKHSRHPKRERSFDTQLDNKMSRKHIRGAYESHRMMASSNDTSKNDDFSHKISPSRSPGQESLKLNVTIHGSVNRSKDHVKKDGKGMCQYNSNRSREHSRNFYFWFSKILCGDSVIVLDNCKIHHADAVDVVWQMGKATYDIDKLFLSSYSPFLNPIGLAFNVFKNLIRTAYFTNTAELIEVIKDKLSEITPVMATKFADNTSKYFNQCLLGLPFQGKPLQPDIPEPTPQPPPTPVPVPLAIAPPSVGVPLLLTQN